MAHDQCSKCGGSAYKVCSGCYDRAVLQIRELKEELDEYRGGLAAVGVVTADPRKTIVDLFGAHHGYDVASKMQEQERLNQELQNQVAHVRHIATVFFSGDPDGPLASILRLTCPKCKGTGAYLEAAAGSDDPIPYPCECQQTEKRVVSSPNTCACLHDVTQHVRTQDGRRNECLASDSLGRSICKCAVFMEQV